MGGMYDWWKFKAWRKAMGKHMTQLGQRVLAELQKCIVPTPQTISLRTLST